MPNPYPASDPKHDIVEILRSAIREKRHRRIVQFAICILILALAVGVELITI